MLSSPLPTSLEYRGRTLSLDLSFNTILKVFKLQEDEDFNQAEKLALFTRMLLLNPADADFFSLEEKAELMQLIFERFITVRSRRPSADKTKSFDFVADAGYIYASFLSDYGIDLFEAQNKLDWRKFIWLFSGLSENAKIMRVISIRTQKIPRATKYNGEERRALMEAKACYALELSEAEREQQFADSLRGFVKNFR